MNSRWWRCTSLTVALFVVGCTPLATADPSTLGCGDAEGVVEFAARDGTKLIADLLPASSTGQPAVALFHMAPPSNDRTGFPPRVRGALGATGVTVLNLDRRGAGSSDGSASEAAGSGALLDAEGAVRFLLEGGLGCPVDRDRMVLIGASNGTTATWDYAAGSDADLPTPASMVWMSPGSYTENQTAIADHRDVIDAIPLLWLYPTDEPWPEDFVVGAPERWRFVQDGGAHGTRMFDGGELEESTLAALTTWVDDVVTAP